MEVIFMKSFIYLFIDIFSPRQLHGKKFLKSNKYK
jgi:hypothetical protein